MNRIHKQAWSPYSVGITLGLLLVAVLLIVGAVPDPSFGLIMAGKPLFVLDPAAPSEGGCPWWQLSLLVGIALGALLSASLSGNRRHEPSPVWKTVLGSPALAVRALAAFAGGVVMMLGAGIAGGDLLGHGLSGVSQLSAGSILALVAIVTGGVLAGRLLGRL